LVLIIGLFLLFTAKSILLYNKKIVNNFIDSHLMTNLLLLGTSLTYYQNFINLSDSLTINNLDYETELDTLLSTLKYSLVSADQINLNVLSKNIHPEFKHQFQNYKNCAKLRYSCLINDSSLSCKKADSLFNKWKNWCDIYIVPYSDSLIIYQQKF